MVNIKVIYNCSDNILNEIERDMNLLFELLFQINTNMQRCEEIISDDCSEEYIDVIEIIDGENETMIEDEVTEVLTADDSDDVNTVIQIIDSDNSDDIEHNFSIFANNKVTGIINRENDMIIEDEVNEVFNVDDSNDANTVIEIIDSDNSDNSDDCSEECIDVIEMINGENETMVEDKVAEVLTADDFDDANTVIQIINSDNSDDIEDNFSIYENNKVTGIIDSENDMIIEDEVNEVFNVDDSDDADTVIEIIDSDNSDDIEDNFSIFENNKVTGIIDSENVMITEDELTLTSVKNALKRSYSRNYYLIVTNSFITVASSTERRRLGQEKRDVIVELLSSENI
ncbi:homeobox-like protein HDP1 [Prorops nasuta]|uniref:homeobox-like protein HDP1 n=1 Tax=Prorops nasuta TaxID=863751 RepID=UPI0034CD3E9C